MIINKKYLSEYSPLPKQYDMTEVLAYVPVAEAVHVIPIIGQDFYNEIQEQIDEDNLSEENATLLVNGGLWRYIAFCSLYEALPFVWTRITEAGIQLGKSDNSDSVSLKDLTLIQSHLKAQINALKQIVIDFLCSHYESYPLFDGEVCPCGCGCKKEITKPEFRDLYTTNRKCGDII